MSRILVTGGAGYVGSICAARLLQEGHEVVVVDDLSAGHLEVVPEGTRFYQADIGDVRTLSAILREHKTEAVFHFAAKALIPESVTNPALFYKVNVDSAFCLVECLRSVGVSQFVFSSTAAVYGSPRVVPIPEDQPKEPVNSYGETKLAFENLLRWYSRAYGWSVVAFRYFNACGATETRGELHEPETHIIPLLLEAASGLRSEFVVYGNDYDTPDRTCLRDYVHVLDIANAHLLALDYMKPGYQVYNIGTGKSHSVLEVSRIVSEVTGRKVPLRFGDRRTGDPAVLCASPAKIQRDFGWQPAHSDLRNIVVSAWDWHQKRSELTVATRLNSRPSATAAI